MALDFIARLDNSDFIKKAQQIKDSISSASQYAEQQSVNINIDTSEAEDKTRQLAERLEKLGGNIPKIDTSTLIDIKGVEDLRQAFNSVDFVIDENQNSIIELQAKLQRLSTIRRDALNAGDDSTANKAQSEAKIVQEIINLRKEAISEAHRYADELVKIEDNLQKEADGTQSIKTKILELEKEAAALALSYVEQGKTIDTNNERYNELLRKIGQLRDIQGDIKKAGSIFANDESHFQGVISGLSGIAGAASAAQGAVSLFAGENEHLQKIMLKVQSLMAITIGLQQVQQTLNKDSAFRLVTLNSLRAWWNRLLAVGRGEMVKETTATVADTTAKTANTAAATAGTAANIGLAGAFRMVGAAIKSIPIFGWIIAGVSALVGVLSFFSSKSSEAKEKAEAFHKAVAEQATEPISKIEELSARWRLLGNDLAAKKKFIDDNKSAFDALGVSIRDVADAENLLIDNKDAFIEAQIQKAIAEAKIKEQQENIQELIKNQSTLEVYQDTLRNLPKDGNEYIINLLNEESEKIQKNIDELNDTIYKGYTGIAEVQEKALDILKDNSIKATDEAEEALSIYTDYILTGIKKSENNVDSFTEKIRNKFSQTINDLRNSTGWFSKMVGDMFGSLFAIDANQNAEIQGDTIAERVKFAIEQYNIAKAELEKLRSDSSTASDKEISELENRMQRLNSAHKTLTGKDIEPSKTGTTSSTDKRAEAQKKSLEELLKLRSENDRQELSQMADGHEKRMRQYDLQLKEEKEKINKRIEELAKLNREAGIVGTNANGLTDEQQSEIDKSTQLAESAYQKQIADEQKMQAQYYLDYLKNYGSFQQQKFAIAKEYDEKIKKLQESGANPWEIKAVERERSNALNSIDNKALVADIDWQYILTGFTSGFEEQMRDSLEKLQDYTKTDEFSSQSVENKKIIYDAIERLQNELPGGSGTLNMGKLNSMLDTLAQKLKDTQEAAIRYEEAQNKVAEAVRFHEYALTTDNSALISAADIQLRTAQENEETAKAAYESLKENAEQYSQDVKKAFKDSNEALEGFAGGLSQLNSGSLRGAYEGLRNMTSSVLKIKDLPDSVKKAMESFSKALDDLPLLGGILDILDVLKEGIGSLISGLIDTVFEAVTGLLDNILSGKFVEQIGTSVYKGVGGLLNTLTFGGLNALFGGDSDKTLERDIERLTASNEALRESIDAMNKDLENASTVGSMDIVKKQQENMAEAMRNTQEMMIRSAAAYSNGFLGIGGHKSSDTKINNGMSADEWRRVSEAAGVTVRSASDFFRLSSEQMYNVLKNAPDLYGKIKDLADDGYRDAAKFMDEYISYWQDIEALWDAWREKVTGTSFDSVRSEFSNMLSDMNSDADTFGENLSETLRKAVVKSMMDTTFNKRLEQWYKNFADAMGDDGELTTGEMERLRQEYDDMANEAIQWRNTLFSTLGLDKTSSANQQNATGGYTTTISEDTGTEVVGRLTAGYLLMDNIFSVNTDILNSSQSILEQMRQDYLIREAISNNVAEIRDYQIQFYNFFDIIAKQSKHLERMDERLEKIEKNTRDM